MGAGDLVFLPYAHPKLGVYAAGFALYALVWASVAAGRPMVPALRGLAALLLLLFLGTAAIYLASPFYEDHVESSIAAIAWLWRNGGPIYHAPDAAARYSYLYGPLTFIFNELPMGAAGPSIIASKLAGFCAALVSVGCIFATGWRLGVRGTGLAAALAGFTAICCTFGNLAYWNRPDSFLLALASIAVLLATFPASVLTAALFGLCAGLMVNLKVYALLFVGPAVVFAWVASARPAAFIVVAALAGLVAGLAPFGLSNVDLSNYLLLLRSASQQGFNPGEVVGVLGMALLCCGPLLLFIRRDRWRTLPLGERWAAGMFFAVAAAVIVPASKIGAGPHHLLPLVPTVIWLFLLRARAPATHVRQPRAVRATAWGATALLLWIAVSGQAQILADAIEQWPAAAAAAREVRAVAEDPAMRPVQVIVRSGVGLSGRVQPVFLGQGYLIDEGALMDMNQAGLPVPDATVAAIRSCQFPTIMLAAGQAPFSDRSYYHDAPLFSGETRDAFLMRYSLLTHGHYFDVWRCGAGSLGKATLAQPSAASGKGF